MSLENPSYTELALDRWRMASGTVKAIIVCAVILVVVGGVLFTIDRLTGWKQARDIKNARIAVNAAANDLKTAQDALTPDKVDIAVKTIQMQEATNAALLAVNATETQKIEVNRASQNLANAAAANRPVGVSAADIEKRLDELGVK